MCCMWASYLPCMELNAIYSKWEIVMVGDKTWCQCYERVYEIILDVVEISTVQQDNN